MKTWILFVTILATSLSAQANTKPNVNGDGVMLDGYDPVSYRGTGGPMPGKKEFQVKEGEVTYLFSNEANKVEFLKNPKKYEPEFDGWCAYAVAVKKEKVSVKATNFLIQKDADHPDGRLLLFYKNIFDNTRDDWQKEKDPKVFLKEADANWSETKTKEPK